MIMYLRNNGYKKGNQSNIPNVFAFTMIRNFLNDKSYEEMQQGFQTGNIEDTFRAAHTLKGLSSNLGMDPLYHALQPIVETLRAGSMPEASDMQEIVELYQKTYSLVETL